MHKKLYIILIAMLSVRIELVSAQIALPVFQAIQKRVASHPGFSVTALSFGNDDQNGTGGDHIEIPWGTGLKDYTVDDSSSFTVTIRAALPVGSNWVRQQCYYTSPAHSIRGSYYYDGGNRFYSILIDTSGNVATDQERGTVTRSTGVANHSTSWAGQYSGNIQMIYYDSEYYFWIGDRGTINASTGAFTSSDSGEKIWFKRNRSYGGNGTNTNVVYDGNDSSSPTVLAEKTASGTYDYVKASHSNVSDFRSGNTGTIISTGLGSTGVGTGSLNYVLDLDGTNDYVDCGNEALGGSISVECWVKPAQIATDWVGFVCKNEDKDSGEGVFWLGQHSTDGKVRFGVYLNGSSERYIDTDGAVISNGSWYHVAATYDGNYQKIYINGTLVKTSSDLNTVLPSGTSNYYIGLSTEAYFAGRIDEVRIWNDVRTAAEIADNKDDELVGNESGLVAYYKMSDGSGTTLTDNSSNSNNGTLTNMTTSGGSSDWVTSNAPIAYDNVYTDYGPAGAVSKNSISFYKNSVYVLTLGVTPDVSGTTSGTGYLGRLCGGDNPYVDLDNVTEWALISYCDPSDITSLHDSQGSTDLRPWAAERGRSLGIYYSLTNALSDGDPVVDLSGNNQDGVARGF